MSPAPGAILLAATLAGFAAVERKAALQLMFSRPIVLGPLLGWALGDVAGGLMLGAPLELLFCGAANLGAILPQHETAATVAIVPAAVAAGAGHVDPGVAFSSFVVLLPVALLGRTIEGFAERANQVVAIRAAEALTLGRSEVALRLHMTGLIWPFMGASSLTVVAFFLGGPLAAGLKEMVDPGIMSHGYALLWAAGGAAAVRAARLPRPLTLAFVGVALACIVAIGMGVLP